MHHFFQYISQSHPALNPKSCCLFVHCHSKDPLPSLSTVRRDEVDDMYVLPALPAAEEKDKSRSEWVNKSSVRMG